MAEIIDKSDTSSLISPDIANNALYIRALTVWKKLFRING